MYNDNGYPFYYISLVTDKSSKATQRKNQFNLYGYPTNFFDGGYKVMVGGSPNMEPTVRNKIHQSRTRDVHELDLELTVTWLGSAEIQIDVSITNNEIIPP